MTRGVQGGAIRAAAVDVCLVALARGPLIRDGHQWRFGRRCFSNTTIKRLINEGEAVRIGDVVRAAVRPAARFPPVRIDEGWSLRKRAYETNLLAAAEIARLRALIEWRQQLRDRSAHNLSEFAVLVKQVRTNMAHAAELLVMLGAPARECLPVTAKTKSLPWSDPAWGILTMPIQCRA
jgi:hypothetical protein